MKNERNLSGRTKLIYEENAYISKFEAEVLSILPFRDCQRYLDSKLEKKDELFAIELNQSAFFPEGGGQSSDTGYLENAVVVDVFKEEGRVYHLTNKIFPIGSHLSCEIDFRKRFRNMQNHSGEHLVCGLIHSLYGYDNVGFHLSDNLVTVDINGSMTLEDFNKVELLANKAVYENKKIEILYLDDDDSMEYRSKIELDEEIRVVVIEGYDACACCAPHVLSTGEIGFIKILDFMNHRSGMRFTLQCGESAYLSMKQIFDQNKEMMNLLSSKREHCAEAVKKQCGILADCHEKEKSLKKEITALYLSQLQSETVFFSETLDDVQLRTIINESVKTSKDIVAGFLKISDHQYRYIIGKNTSSLINLKELSKELSTLYHGRGGGSDKMVQGTVFASEQELKEFILNEISLVNVI